MNALAEAVLISLPVVGVYLLLELLDWWTRLKVEQEFET